jgi:hypothetical protein
MRTDVANAEDHNEEVSRRTVMAAAACMGIYPRSAQRRSRRKCAAIVRRPRTHISAIFVA